MKHGFVRATAFTCLAVMGLASAYAHDGVRLYGIIDAGVAHYDGLNAGTAAAPRAQSITQMVSGGQSPSRIGIQGSESLGSGNSVFFTVETGFCAVGLDQAGASPSGYCSADGFMQRQSLLGARGAYGKLSFGKMYSMNFIDEVRYIDPFHWGMTGTYSSLSPLFFWGNESKGHLGALQMVRLNQSIEYATPVIGGWSGGLGYVFNGASSSASAQTRSTGVEAALKYHRGRILFGVDYIELGNLQNFGSGYANGSKASNWKVFGGYRFDAAKLTGLYQRFSIQSMSGSVDSWLVGLTVPRGTNSLLASVAQTRSSMWGLSDARALQWAVGAQHDLSKNTDLYASYARVSNSGGSALAVGDGTSGFLGVPDQSSTGVVVGLRHTF